MTPTPSWDGTWEVAWSWLQAHPLLVALALALITTAAAVAVWTVATRSAAGMATRAEATSRLGAGALAARRREIRPDLTTRRPGREVVGWRIGRCGPWAPSAMPGRGGLWIPYDRTTCVIGPQGSGKTLDLLAPALLAAPGGALVTLTKPEDLFLTLGRRSQDGRPVAVLDPFDLAGDVPQLIWDPIAGCDDAMVAERRAHAFAAGGRTSRTASDDAARFYAGECAKVLQGYFHAAALLGADLDDVLEWVADPLGHRDAEETLRTHPRAERHWDGLLRGALRGDERTASNTITTVQQTLGLFFQSQLRARCVPSPQRPATDLEDLIRRNGTIYLLGRDDPYVSAAPLLTAVAEHVLDLAKRRGEHSPLGRMTPAFLACLDELPSTAPIPTLLTRMANERALGMCFIVAAQTWKQLVTSFSEDGARTLLGLSNNLVVFGGGKDARFYQEMSDLAGQTWKPEVRYSSRGGRWSLTAERSWTKVRRPVLEAAEIRRIPARQALLLAESTAPIRLHLTRCIDGRSGRLLLAEQAAARTTSRAPVVTTALTPGRTGAASSATS
jgi:type IV secretion system protein VirD4